jgi:hypothetical protein
MVKEPQRYTCCCAPRGAEINELLCTTGRRDKRVAVLLQTALSVVFHRFETLMKFNETTNGSSGAAWVCKAFVGRGAHLEAAANRFEAPRFWTFEAPRVSTPPPPLSLRALLHCCKFPGMLSSPSASSTIPLPSAGAHPLATSPGDGGARTPGMRELLGCDNSSATSAFPAEAPVGAVTEPRAAVSTDVRSVDGAALWTIRGLSKLDDKPGFCIFSPEFKMAGTWSGPSARAMLQARGSPR